MFSKQLSNNCFIREASTEELNACLDKHFEKVYANRASSMPEFAVDPKSLEKIKLRKDADRRYRLKLLIFHENEAIGWHYGYSTDSETYYMQNSAVIAEHRNKGLYGNLLSAVLEKTGEDGFQVVTSIHHPNNPAVLIPKLKNGFVISGMYIHERFKSVIELKYFFSADRRKNYNQTIGLDI